MGLDFYVCGVTLSKRKIDNKGLQYFINNGKYYNEVEKNYYHRFNFELDFSRPTSFMELLLKNSTEYCDEHDDFSENIYVLTAKQLINLMDSEFNEKELKHTYDLEHYYRLMPHIYNIKEYNNKFYDFYLIMKVSA